MRPTVLLLLLLLAVALGAGGLYRYESTRAIVCGANAVPIGANLNAYVVRLDPSVSATTLAPYVISCRARIDAANGRAQAAYLAYGGLVLAAAATWLLAERRRPRFSAS